MKLQSIKINGRAIEEGAWVGALPAMPGVRLRVRGQDNADYKRLQARLTRDIPRERRLFGLDPIDADEIEAQCIAETVLMGWEGIEEDGVEVDEKGKPISVPLPYSKEFALQLLVDPDFLVFRNSVIYASAIVTTTQREDADADKGN